MLPLNCDAPMRTDSRRRSAAQNTVLSPSGALNSTTSATFASDT